MKHHVNRAVKHAASTGRQGCHIARFLYVCTALWIAVRAAHAATDQTHDFGTMIRGFANSNSFIITNHYASALHITKVRLLCPCVKTVSYDAVIPTEGTGRVTLLLETATLFEGKVRYATMVHVSTNEAAQAAGGDQEILQLVMQATIVDDVATVPAANECGRITAGGRAAPFHVDVYSRTGREITALRTTTIPAWLGATAMPFAADTADGVTSRWRILFSCTNPPPIGSLDISAMFTVTLTNAQHQALPTNSQHAVQIKGVVDPVVSPQPPLVLLMQVAVSSSVDQTVAFPSPAGPALHLSGARSSGTAVVVSTFNTNDPHNVSIVLRIRPEHAGMIDETVTLTTDLEAQPEVSVRVLGNAR